MKATVLEKKNGRCVVLRRDGVFEETADKGRSVGQQVHLPPQGLGFIRTAAACLVLLCALAAGGLAVLLRPAGYVYVDINPSLRLDVNCLGRVIRVVPLNADAQALLSGQSPDQSSAAACVENIVTLCREQAYLNENNTDIEITLAQGDAALAKSMKAVSDTLEQDALEVNLYAMEESDNQEALKSRLPARRLRALKAYGACFGGELSENEELLRDVSVKEIYERIREYRRSQKELPPAPENSRSGAVRLSPKRLETIRAYTRVYGGTVKENMELLEGLSSREIRALLRKEKPAAREETGVIGELPAP